MHLSSCLCKNGMIRARPNKRMQLARLRRDVHMAVAKNMAVCEWVSMRDAVSGASGVVAPPRG